MVSRDCCFALPHGAIGLPAVGDCGIPDHNHLLFFIAGWKLKDILFFKITVIKLAYLSVFWH